jgi:hypothetical protein
MTTKKQIAANRRNAKKSTGPKTPEGKARSSQNRMTHGLLSRQVLLREEDPELFRAVQGQVWEELRPVGELETYLAARVVAGIWRMNRVARIEASLFNDSPIRALGDDIGIGAVFRADCAHGANAFYRLCRYETTIDRGIHRALNALRTMQAARPPAAGPRGGRRRPGEGGRAEGKISIRTHSGAKSGRARPAH